MTLLSRRKHPTINLHQEKARRSRLRGKAWRLCLSLAIAAAPLGVCWDGQASAGERDSTENSASGNSGKLNWKPTRPTTTRSVSSQSSAPQTLNVDPEAKPISSAKAASTSDPFSDPFGDNEPSAKPRLNAFKADQGAKRIEDAEKSETRPTGGSKKTELPWKDPAVIQVVATMPVSQTKFEPKVDSKATALNWIRPKTPGDKSKAKLSEDKPRLLEHDDAKIEALKSAILPVMNQEPRAPRPPSVEEKIANQLPGQLDPCPKEDKLPGPINKIRSDIRPYVRDPKTNVASDQLDTRELPPECPLTYEVYRGRNWGCTNYTWKASGLCHKPLYFEQVAVERYGHTFGGPLLSPILQPAVSTVHFFGSALILPYKAGMDLPWECQYSLGYYRPGNCAPFSIGPVPLSARGALLEAGVTVGLIFLIP